MARFIIHSIHAAVRRILAELIRQAVIRTARYAQASIAALSVHNAECKKRMIERKGREARIKTDAKIIPRT